MTMLKKNDKQDDHTEEDQYDGHIMVCNTSNDVIDADDDYG